MPDAVPVPVYSLRPATTGDFAFLYDPHVACLKKYVEAIWGWDEALQRTIFTDSFAPEGSRIVHVDGRAVRVIATGQGGAGW